MTDRLKGVYVEFDHDIREDDARYIIDAIKMIKGVGAVSGSVVNPDDWMNRRRIGREYQQKLLAVFSESE